MEDRFDVREAALVPTHEATVDPVVSPVSPEEEGLIIFMKIVHHNGVLQVGYERSDQRPSDVDSPELVSVGEDNERPGRGAALAGEPVVLQDKALLAITLVFRAGYLAAELGAGPPLQARMILTAVSSVLLQVLASRAQTAVTVR